MLACIIQLFTYSHYHGVYYTTQQGQCLLWHGCCFIMNRKIDNGTILWRCSKCTCRRRGFELLLSFLSFLFIYACTYITHLKITLIITLYILGHGSKCLDIMGLDFLGLDILGIIQFHTRLLLDDFYVANNGSNNQGIFQDYFASYTSTLACCRMAIITPIGKVSVAL